VNGRSYRLRASEEECEECECLAVLEDEVDEAEVVWAEREPPEEVEGRERPRKEELEEGPCGLEAWDENIVGRAGTGGIVVWVVEGRIRLNEEDRSRLRRVFLLFFGLSGERGGERGGERFLEKVVSIVAV
jgi:hypothetical protein